MLSFVINAGAFFWWYLPIITFSTRAGMIVGFVEGMGMILWMELSLEKVKDWLKEEESK